MRGQVERDRDGQPSRLPGCVLAQRCTQHPATQRPNKPGLLGNRDEHIWRNQPALRVTPADQRFDGGQRARPDVHLRLVVQDELAAVDRVAQVSLQA